MWKVYKRTFPNGKVYIGITSKTLEERLQAGYSNNHKLALAIVECGKENLISEVLEEYQDYDTAHERELYYIQQYKDICYNKVGNAKSRGKSCTVPPAQSNPQEHTCTEKSAHYKSHILPLTTKPIGRHSCPISVYDLTGKYITTYESAKIASKETGVNNGEIINCCKGSRSNGRNRYQSKGLIFRYAVDKLNEFPEKNLHCKSINQYTLDGEYIRTFNSIKDAWLKTGISQASIIKVCKGITKSTKGYIWKYAETEKEVG